MAQPWLGKKQLKCFCMMFLGKYKKIFETPWFPHGFPSFFHWFPSASCTSPKQRSNKRKWPRERFWQICSILGGCLDKLSPCQKTRRNQNKPTKNEKTTKKSQKIEKTTKKIRKIEKCSWSVLFAQPATVKFWLWPKTFH